MNINFMKHNKLFLILPLFLVLSVIPLFLFKGINYGIDFTGGTLIQVKFEKEQNIELLRNKINKEKGFETATIQFFGDEKEITIRTNNSNKELDNSIESSINNILKDYNFVIRKIDVVGPKIGDELKEKSIFASILTLFIILIYLYYRFQKEFAFNSVIALFHDLIITIGILIILGIEFNTEMIAALLTLLGYSLNDTIIVFDRIREEIHKTKTKNKLTLENILNKALNKVFKRTILTSVTTLFVLLNLVIFGGESLQGFALTLLIGIIVGTYSSIFIASSLLIQIKFDYVKFNKLMKQKEEEAEKKRKHRERTHGAIL